MSRTLIAIGAAVLGWLLLRDGGSGSGGGGGRVDLGEFAPPGSPPGDPMIPEGGIPPLGNGDEGGNSPPGDPMIPEGGIPPLGNRNPQRDPVDDTTSQFVNARTDDIEGLL